MQSLSDFGAIQACGGNDEAIPPGALDGVTIMRYAHIHKKRATGGVEQHLRLLDHSILRRHRMTVLQMHLTEDSESRAIESEVVGKGRIVWIPVSCWQSESPRRHFWKRVQHIYDHTYQLSRQKGRRWYQASSSSVHSLLRNHCAHLRHRSAILSDQLADLLAQYGVDLLVLHWLSYDTSHLIARAMSNQIPFVFINHFGNVRFSLPLTQSWIPHAAGLGAVSSNGLPEGLQKRCVNLSDAIDTEFFTPFTVPAGYCPTVLLPARMHAGKGHHDLLEAARSLASENINFTVCFAGAVDSETLHRELRTLVAATGLENRTLFLGDQSAAEMRRLYARSNMVVLPSASEGLPRVLLEAQAMKKPVVAYDSGGVSETMLPNESGFLVKRGDVRALTDRMRFLLTHADERLRMGELARAFVCERFGVESLTRRHEAFYLSTLAPRFAASSQRTPLQERRVTPACVGAQSIEPE